MAGPYGWKRQTFSAAISTDYAMVANLLIAYIDDAHAAGDTEALRILYRREKTD
jgi:hypothetical protein